jgi:aspartate racemase
MKTIGLIGGMSWESTLEYYRIINETVKEKLGGFHSAKIVMYSVDFAEVETMQHTGAWDQAAVLLAQVAKRVEKAGADFALICANTMHKVFDQVQGNVQIPLIHIVDVTAQAIKGRGVRTAGLLGTRYTMEQPFYKDRLAKVHGIEVLIPEAEERRAINDILYNELCLGDIKKVSRDTFRKTIANLESRGAEGIILGCTEIPLLIDPSDYNLPLFDTTALHARAAVELALQE